MAEDSSKLIIIPPEPPSQNEMVRLAFATEKIGAARLFGDARSVDEIIGASGLYHSAAAYWRTSLAVPMRALAFADLLFTHQIDPSASREQDAVTRLAIEHAILEGVRDGADWIFRDPLAKDGKGGHLGPMRVQPRDAALWLLKSPWAHFVPPSLKDLLESEQRGPPPAQPISPAPSNARPGRPSSQDLIREEAERRLTANADLPPTLTQFGDELAAWLRREHPDAAQMTGTTARHHISEMWNKWRKL